jgi:cyclic beta-1,2-glucan synthetase
VLGRGDAAHAAFDLLNPIHTAPDVYKGEPYVLAGDVYSCPPHVGRCGWTWYTGSSGWLYRVGLEDLLGIRRQAGSLTLDPCVPASWEKFTVRFRFGKTVYVLEVRNPERISRGVVRITLDGSATDATSIPLEDTGDERLVSVEMGAVVRDAKQLADQPDVPPPSPKAIKP